MKETVFRKAVSNISLWNTGLLTVKLSLETADNKFKIQILGVVKGINIKSREKQNVKILETKR